MSSRFMLRVDIDPIHQDIKGAASGWDQLDHGNRVWLAYGRFDFVVNELRQTGGIGLVVSVGAKVDFNDHVGSLHV